MSENLCRGVVRSLIRAGRWASRPAFRLRAGALATHPPAYRAPADEEKWGLRAADHLTCDPMVAIDSALKTLPFFRRTAPGRGPGQP
jgi:hypothetical protein